MTNRIETQLDILGEPVALCQAQDTDIGCHCFGERNADRECQYCNGTGYVVGYSQYFNPNRADRMLMMRFTPEQNEAWTIVCPTINVRDIVIRSTEYGDDRYEVLSVDRSRENAQALQLRLLEKCHRIHRMPIYKSTRSP